MKTYVSVSLLLSVLIMTCIERYGHISVISHFAIDRGTVLVVMNALTAQRDSSYHYICCGITKQERRVVS